MRPPASVSGTRCTRCTPLSKRSRPNTPAPVTLATASFTPPRPVSEMLSSSNRQPARASVTLIHAQQIAGEQRGFFAARAGAHFQDGGRAFVLVLRREQQQRRLLQLGQRSRALCSSSRAIAAISASPSLAIASRLRDLGAHGVHRRDRIHQRLQLGVLLAELDDFGAVRGRAQPRFHALEAFDRLVQAALQGVPDLPWLHHFGENLGRNFARFAGRRTQ